MLKVSQKGAQRAFQRNSTLLKSKMIFDFEKKNHFPTYFVVTYALRVMNYNEDVKFHLLMPPIHKYIHLFENAYVFHSELQIAEDNSGDSNSSNPPGSGKDEDFTPNLLPEPIAGNDIFCLRTLH